MALAQSLAPQLRSSLKDRRVENKAKCSSFWLFSQTPGVSVARRGDILKEGE